MSAKLDWKEKYRLSRLAERRATKARIRSREFLANWAERMTLAKKLLDAAAQESARIDALYDLSTK